MQASLVSKHCCRQGESRASSDWQPRLSPESKGIPRTACCLSFEAARMACQGPCMGALLLGRRPGRWRGPACSHLGEAPASGVCRRHRGGAASCSQAPGGADVAAPQPQPTRPALEPPAGQLLPARHRQAQAPQPQLQASGCTCSPCMPAKPSFAPGWAYPQPSVPSHGSPLGGLPCASRSLCV